MQYWNHLSFDIKREILVRSLKTSSLILIVRSQQVLRSVSKEISQIFRQWSTWRCILQRCGFIINDKVEIPQGGFSPLSVLFNVRESPNYEFNTWRYYKVTSDNVSDDDTIATDVKRVYSTQNYLVAIANQCLHLYKHPPNQGLSITPYIFPVCEVSKVRETSLGLMIIASLNGDDILFALHQDNTFVQMKGFNSNNSEITYYGIYRMGTIQKWKWLGNEVVLDSKTYSSIRLPIENIYIEGVGNTDLDLICARDFNSVMFLIHSFRLSITIWSGCAVDYISMNTIDRLIVVDKNVCDVFTGEVIYEVGKFYQITRRMDGRGYDIWPYKAHKVEEIDED